MMLPFRASDFPARDRMLTMLAVVLVSMALAVSGCASPPTPTPTPTKTPTPATAAMSTPTPGSIVITPPAPPTTPEPPTATPTLAGNDPTAPPQATDAPPPPADTATPTPVPPAPTRGTGGPVAMRSPDFGAQAFLWWRPEVADRDLGLMRDAGFHWVKQWFAWQDIEGAGRGQYDWSRTDRIVAQVEQYGLKLLVRVSPTADRAFWAGNPPENADDFAAFVAALARRYRGRIHAYQIWNEPNLAREWGNKPPDPAGYVQMLRKAYRAIKAEDPNALVITAGMAPTTADQAEAMYDMKFYELMYQAMGGNSDGYFDMLGAHAAGYAVPPETDPGAIPSNPAWYNRDPSPPERLRVYSFRHVEDIRRLMERYGDGRKKIVILEFGWTFDPRPDSPYYWHGGGAGIDPFVQADYLVRAYKWAQQNWPWVGLMSLIYMPDSEWTPETEQYYWSIMDPSPPGHTYWRPAFIALCVYLNSLRGTTCPYAPR